MIYPWCFPHLIGFLIDFLCFVVLHICIGSTVVVVVYCTLCLYIVPLAPLGTPRGLTMFYPSPLFMMRVNTGVGGRLQAWSFCVFRLQLSCQDIKNYNVSGYSYYSHVSVSSLGTIAFLHAVVRFTDYISTVVGSLLSLGSQTNTIISPTWWYSTPNSPAYYVSGCRMCTICLFLSSNKNKTGLVYPIYPWRKTTLTPISHTVPCQTRSHRVRS